MQNKSYRIGVNPPDILTKILLFGYRARDVRTAVWVVNSASWCLYISFLLSNLFFFLCDQDFFYYNKKIFLILPILVSFVCFLKYGLDQGYPIGEFRLGTALFEAIFCSICLWLTYDGLYNLAISKLEQTDFKIYLVFVVLHSITATINAAVICHGASNFLRFYERYRI